MKVSQRFTQTFRLSVGLVAALSLMSPLASRAELGSGSDDDMSGAKGLFFEQLEKPSQNLNTGIRYSIELKRNGKTQRVSNKFQFRTGDSIRFHVTSNINGFAYILLSSGSRGEQSVLFPDESTKETNRVERGKEYVMPGKGFLTFDENPGTEKLTLLLSRSPINASAYMQKHDRPVTMIASAETGAKDLVPARIYVAYNTPRLDGAALNSLSGSGSNSSTTVSSSSSAATESASTSKKVKTTKVAETKKEPVKSHKVKTASAAGNAGAGSGVAAAANRVIASGKVKEDDAATTVVSADSDGMLHVDVALEHL
ncbi:MAG: DUF4384 domain-containing protein [Candidatus Obscuribacterales bacterium]|jgi:hypothetical protein|nr:DUF4384 domain-containing protein [Candidatus Obscuribacterales bacterium]